jgi:hypothetical protein
MGSTQLLAGLDNILTRVSMDLNTHDTNLRLILLDLLHSHHPFTLVHFIGMLSPFHYETVVSFMQ